MTIIGTGQGAAQMLNAMEQSMKKKNTETINRPSGSSDAPRHDLRSTPKTVPTHHFKEEFGLDDNYQPRQYIPNDYKVTEMAL
jgi:hypothetical protein